MGKIINSIAKSISSSILFFGSKFNNIAKRIAQKIYRPQPSLKDLGWQNFVNAGGEKLRYDYYLNEESVLFDLGGYDGQFASDFYSKYGCNIYIFEAYTPYAEQIANRFSRNSKIHTYSFGLSERNCEIEISIDSVASSTFKQSKNMAVAQLREASTFIDELKIPKIDLMKINIEGGEYDLLDHIINSKKIEVIENIQVQFHDFVPNAVDRMLSIRKLLAKTHKPTYLCDFIWENWTIIK